MAKTRILSVADEASDATKLSVRQRLANRYDESNTNSSWPQLSDENNGSDINRSAPVFARRVPRLRFRPRLPTTANRWFPNDIRVATKYPSGKFGPAILSPVRTISCPFMAFVVGQYTSRLRGVRRPAELFDRIQFYLTTEITKNDCYYTTGTESNAVERPRYTKRTGKHSGRRK